MMAFNAFGTILGVAGIGAMNLSSLCLGSAIAGSAGFLYQHYNKDRARAQGRWSQNADGMQQIASGLGASGMVMGAGAAATCLMVCSSHIIYF